MPAFKRRTEEGGCPCPSYTCTAWPRATSATGPLSAPSTAHFNAGWQAEYELWRIRSVADLEAVHLRVDGVYVNPDSRNIRPRSSSSLAALRTGQEMILAVESGYRESTESWAAILRDLKRGDPQGPKLGIGDEHLRLWGAMAAVFPEAGAAVLEPSLS